MPSVQELLHEASAATLREVDAIRSEFHCENRELLMERLLAAQLAVLRRLEFGVFELLEYKRNEVNA